MGAVVKLLYRIRLGDPLPPPPPPYAVVPRSIRVIRGRFLKAGLRVMRIIFSARIAIVKLQKKKKTGET